MTHFSENSNRLAVKQIPIRDHNALLEEARDFDDVCLLRLPPCPQNEHGNRLQGIERITSDVVENLGPKATLIILGEAVDLVYAHAAINLSSRYQHWITIKQKNTLDFDEPIALPQHHFSALIHTKYKTSLKHAKTRIKYTYCPACHKTTKDYGGKKHTYHEYGTLMSDVWRDISCDLDDDLTPILERFADLFGVESYRELRVLDCRELGLKRVADKPVTSEVSEAETLYRLPENSDDKLLLGDCLEHLRKLSDDSVDFAFADPPYNLRKKYASYEDDLEVTRYFDWCDEWISEMTRVLRPGRTCAILNIPLWAIRHCLYLEKVLKFQSWIVWDALSYPVRKIMPAHYAILCFSKGVSRELPALTTSRDVDRRHTASGSLLAYDPLKPLAEGFCLRSGCVESRRVKRIDDSGPLTDLWWDVHRLKHNSRRVDHPTQLPPQLMHRLISLFTNTGETVLDCFNGAGTTTLAAHQLNRRYVGIEISEKYHEVAQSRHEEVRRGLDPFRKVERTLTAKNSPVPRRPKQKYEVSKKVLQLEVRRVAAKLGRLPSREELAAQGEYPIKYYDEYFASWGEVCAAARTTGMTEKRGSTEDGPRAEQLNLLNLQ